MKKIEIDNNENNRRLKPMKKNYMNTKLQMTKVDCCRKMI